MGNRNSRSGGKHPLNTKLLAEDALSDLAAARKVLHNAEHPYGSIDPVSCLDFGRALFHQARHTYNLISK